MQKILMSKTKYEQFKIKSKYLKSIRKFDVKIKSFTEIKNKKFLVGF